MAKSPRTKSRVTLSEMLEGVRRPLEARDAQLEADRQAVVAAERERWGITDRPPPEWLRWKAQLEQLDDLSRRLAQLGQQLREQLEAGTVPLPDPGGWVDVDPFTPEPPGSPIRGARLRALAARGGAAAARKKLAKYASPDVVRAIVADIKRVTPDISQRKLCAQVRLRISKQLGTPAYPSHNFSGWLNAILEKN